MSLIVDIEGTKLSGTDKEILQHPAIGGVILFSRNYNDPTQLTALTTAIRELRRSRPLVIFVDQEGGRVQRFRREFSVVPAMHRFGEFYDTNSEGALELLEQCGWLLAAELLACGVDASFAPVLDLAVHADSVIGDRALHQQPQTVAILAHSFITGMQRAGMLAIGKHFPGHGGVELDSHLASPINTSTFEELLATEIYPYSALIKQQCLTGIMIAHVIYGAVDPNPATFSEYWLKQVLRHDLAYDGIIFTDDCSMTAAVAYHQDPVVRVKYAYTAGNDCVLLCNNRSAVLQVLASKIAIPTCQALGKFMQHTGAGRNNRPMPLQQWHVLQHNAEYSYAKQLLQTW